MPLQDRVILDMQIDFEEFFTHKIPAIIDSIKGDEPAKWGLMTVHHMLEHLVLPLNFAIGTLPMSTMIAEEKIPRQLAFLASEYGLPKNFKPAFLPSDKTLPLMYADIAQSKQLLKDTIVKFLASVNATTFANATHPFYGPLDKTGWLQFQYKHFIHHFSQFGLL